MNDIVEIIIGTVINLLSSFLLFFIGKWVYQLLHQNINVKEELVIKDNFAFSVAHTGYLTGVLLAIGSSLIGESNGLVNDLMDLFFYGFLAIALLNISLVINDKVILRNFKVYDEIIRDQNTGTGVIDAANSIATGLIILGAISGEGGSWFTAITFWLVGQVLIVITSIVYSALVPYDVHDYIEKDNVAAGIGFAGAIIAIANLIRSGLMHDFVSWADSSIILAIEVTIGLLFLPIARFIADKILLPGQNLTDEIIHQEKPNNGAAIIEAFAYIGSSVLISWCI